MALGPDTQDALDPGAGYVSDAPIRGIHTILYAQARRHRQCTAADLASTAFRSTLGCLDSGSDAGVGLAARGVCAHRGWAR